MELISVIIPAHNEEERVGNVIDKLRQTKSNIEIIVVDNCSTDNTSNIALEKKVILAHCDNRGKGYAMETGLQYAKGNIIVFVDGDLEIFIDDLVTTMVTPIINNEADFTKSAFKREGGRVTELVVKPLLDLLYPNMYKFEQPLSGIIAGKKEIFEKIQFEKDYGVDIGILLDVLSLTSKVKEIHIGRIENNSQSWHALSDMAKEVAKAILKRCNIENVKKL